MIDNLISEHISGNKRLVIPDFGAFIRKDEGEVVFVEFLKKDDQVLSSLVRSAFNVSEAEARTIIASYVDKVKATVAASGGYAIAGLGTIYTSKNGVYELNCPAECDAPTTTESGKDEIAPTAAKADDIAMDTETTQKNQVLHSPGESRADEAPQESSPSSIVKEEGKVEESSANKHYSDEDIVKGLRYQKPAKPSVDVRQKKKRADMVMIIAIAAALLAIGSIIFGMMVNNSPASKIQPTNPQEEVEAIEFPAAIDSLGIAE